MLVFLTTREPIYTAEDEVEPQKAAAEPVNAGATAADAYTGLATCAPRKRNDSIQAGTWLHKAMRNSTPTQY